MSSATRCPFWYLWLGIIIATSCGGGAADMPRLAAEVEITPMVVTVLNKDQQDWTNVTVMINNKYFCPDRPKIAKDANEEISLGSCSSSRGERFQPRLTAAVLVTVEATLAREGVRAIAGFSPSR